MSYAVVFLDEFTKQFRRLPNNVKARVRQRIIEVAENPYLGIRLVGELSAFWKDFFNKTFNDLWEDTATEDGKAVLSRSLTASHG